MIGVDLRALAVTFFRQVDDDVLRLKLAEVNRAGSEGLNPARSGRRRKTACRLLSIAARQSKPMATVNRRTYRPCLARQTRSRPAHILGRPSRTTRHCRTSLGFGSGIQAPRNASQPAAADLPGHREPALKHNRSRVLSCKDPGDPSDACCTKCARFQTRADAVLGVSSGCRGHLSPGWLTNGSTSGRTYCK